ncbi:glycerophosphodiester phosphodiesterase family protein [Tabrizicola sp.]|uniref:glycerophosphodiester phosphodiesterase family protein n=1 Tax=Tabrizicola sp. TaxID=2005166 RepID=UPI003D27CF32
MPRPVPLPDALLHLPIAHRALHDRSAGRPENSPAAIRAAVEAGYAIEIDVQGTRDGQAVVFHDEWMERLTAATGFVKNYTAAELGQIPLRDSRETIPSLRQVLDMVAGRAPLLIEIKDQTDRMAETDGQLESAVAQALAGYTGPVAVMSFNPHAVANMARLAPQIARGITTAAYDYEGWAPLSPDRCNALREIADYDRVAASFISHEAADLSRPRVAALKSQGAAILTWTIKSPEEEAQARKVAQNITFEGYLAIRPT